MLQYGGYILLLVDKIITDDFGSLQLQYECEFHPIVKG